MAVLRKTISQAENTASSDLATLQGADNFATDLDKPASDVSQALEDCHGMSRLNRAKRVSAHRVVEPGSGPAAARSGGVIRPQEPDALIRSSNRQAVREVAVATGADHYLRAEELLSRHGPLTGEMLAAAQAHAMLALTAATALIGGDRIEADA